MTSNRPYLIRAVYQWIVDNSLTPYLLVDASYEGAIVPEKHVENGKIILNVTPQAVQNLQLENEIISFQASFTGSEITISFSPEAVLAIYARENGQGMMFPQEGNPDSDETDSGKSGSSSSPSKAKKPSLKVIK